MLHLFYIFPSVFSQKLDPKLYPPAGIPPPINPEWSKLFLKDIPDIPVRTAPVPVFDWEEDITSCLEPTDWALTYDDGTSVFTTNVTQELDNVQGKATFFVIGGNVLTFSKQLKSLHDKGHQIGIHTWSHTELTLQTNDQIVSELIWTAKIIKDVTGVTPRYVRGPSGDIDPRVRAVIHSMGFVHAAWNRDTFDWKLQNYKVDNSTLNNNTTISNSTIPQQPSDIIKEFSNWFNETEEVGRISLQHDAFRFPASVIGTTIKMVKENNFNIKTISECIQDPKPYDESVLEKIAQIKTGFEPQVNGTRTVSVTTLNPTSSPTNTLDSLPLQQGETNFGIRMYISSYILFFLILSYV